MARPVAGAPDTAAEGSGAPRTGGVAVAGRLGAALGVAAALCALAWQLVPHQLSVTTDVVGYPIFADFDLHRYFDAFYLIVLAFPALATALYVLLAGRARPVPGAARAPVLPVVTRRATPDAGHEEAPAALGALRRAGRIAVPALTVTVAVGVAAAGHGARLSPWGAAAGGAYVVAVAGAGRLLRGGRAAAVVNGGAALVVVPLVYAVSHTTAVAVRSPHGLVRYPWMPWWLVVGALAALVAWYVRRQRGAGAARAADTEAAVLTYVVGPVALLVMAATVPGALDTPFFAFDQAQTFSSAQLAFGHGLAPWRDLYVIHGVFPDILSGQLGLSVFAPSRWGSTAGFTVFLIPLLWVSLYLFAVFFARRNRLAGAAFVAVCVLWLGPARLAGAGLVFSPDVQAVASGYVRFAFLPLVLVLFAAVLARRSRLWCAALAAALVAQALVVPETALMAACVVLTLVLFEAAARPRGGAWGPALFRTRWCLLAGAVAAAVTVVVLAATGALGAFVDYYVVFGPGHALSGALPAAWIGTQLGPTVELVVPALLVMATVWRVVWMLRGRRRWDVSDWVLVACALFVVAYFDKVLARADPPHMAEVFTVSLPLVILWAVVGLHWLDGALRTLLTRRAGRTGRAALAPWHLGTLATVVVLVAAAPAPVSAVEDVAGHFHPSAPGPPQLARLGYALPGMIDTAMVRHLGASLDTLAGAGAPVFDFNDEPGLLYFLLGRVPGTRFFTVSMAITAYAQHALVADLERSRPPVVVFYGTGIGLPQWDGIEATVRHYDVSDYLLGHYRPWGVVDGQFLMVRTDLAASVPPPPAPARVDATAFYLSNPGCDWGSAPDFLDSPPRLGQARSLAARTAVTSPGAAELQGWAFDPATGRAPPEVLAVRGTTEVARAVPNSVDPGGAGQAGAPSSSIIGFDVVVPEATGDPPVSLYAANADGTVSPLAPGHGVSAALVRPGTGSVVMGADGAAHRVDHQSVGQVVLASSGPSRITALGVAPGTDLAAYHWLELSSPRRLGAGRYSIMAANDAGGRLISFRTLPRAGHHLYVEVGSCPQWHGLSVAGLSMVGPRGATSPPSVRLLR